MTKVRFFARVAVAVATLTVASSAWADLLIKVDQSTQRMSVDVDGQRVHDWAVSTGKPGYETPRGTFRPNRMDADHYSQEYDNAPMPHAIFFDLNGHAIHGSFDPIGKPAASHGCVRLSPENAAKLFALVSQQKMAKTRVEIGGDVMVALRNAKATKTAKASPRQRQQDYAAQRQQDPYLFGESDGASPYGREIFLRERPSQDALYGLY